MDYKKLIKDRNMRLKILSLLNWIPDKEMIKFQYRLKTGRKLNLKNPTRYTEKLQCYKLYHRDPLMAQCADKYTVHEYVKSKGLGSILNEIYDVYDDPNEINFNKLPNQFVLKRTNGGGGNDVLICKEKSRFDIKNALEKMKTWTEIKNTGGGREWVYYKIKPRIIAEKFIESENDDLIDYKFFCFNGKPHYLYVINGRKLGEEIKLGIFDLEYNQLPYFRGDENRMLKSPDKPENFEQMINIAKDLSKDFHHVRVDLYNVKGKIIFGELTFFDGSGYQTYEPDEFDVIMGDKFKLPKKILR
ncbi:ATP-grasp fold amidoligase family protein [Clostridium cadaveris]